MVAERATIQMQITAVEGVEGGPPSDCKVQRMMLSRPAVEVALVAATSEPVTEAPAAV